jgi:crossover junction endodeoxyribonuclease RusA
MNAAVSLGVSFALPFPLSALNPNSRFHWTVVGNEKAMYRQKANIEAKQARIRADIYLGDMQAYVESCGGKLPITITFSPRRVMDDDNIIASFKAGRDGIADGLGIDDKLFLVTYKFEPPTKKGWVKIEI